MGVTYQWDSVGHDKLMCVLLYRHSQYIYPFQFHSCLLKISLCSFHRNFIDDIYNEKLCNRAVLVIIVLNIHGSRGIWMYLYCKKQLLNVYEITELYFVCISEKSFMIICCK